MKIATVIDSDYIGLGLLALSLWGDIIGLDKNTRKNLAYAAFATYAVITAYEVYKKAKKAQRVVR